MRACTWVLFAAVTLVATGTTSAGTMTYIGSDDSWGNPGSWSPGGLPSGTSDVVYSGTNTGRILTFTFGTNAAPNSLTITGGLLKAVDEDTITPMSLGPVTLNNGGMLELSANGSSGGIVTLSSNVTIGTYGGGLGGNTGVQTGGPDFSMSGNLFLGGVMQAGTFVTLGGNGSGHSVFYSGTANVDQTIGGVRGVVSHALTNGGDLTRITGNIVDSAGSAGNALYLKAVDGRIFISGTNNTYSGGTVIERGYRFGLGGPSYVEVSTNATLGTGNVTVRPGGFLSLTATGNIASGRTVTLESSKVSLATLELGNPDMLGSIGNLINPSSSGKVSISGGLSGGQTFGTGQFVNMSTIGNGRMWFGTSNDGGYALTNFRGTLGAGSDNVYRVDVEQGTKFVTLGAQADGSFLTGTASAVLRGRNFLSGQAELQQKIGELALTGGVTMDHLMYRNTDEGNGSGVGIAPGGVTVHPFGNGALTMIQSRADWYPLMTSSTAMTASVGTVGFSSHNILFINNNGNVTQNDLTLGSLTRQDQGILSIQNFNSSTKRIFVNVGLAVTNGMVAPYLLGVSDFLTYSTTGQGVQAVAYDALDPSGATSTQKVSSGTGSVIVSSAVYALKTTGVITLNADLRIASGGLILGSNITTGGGNLSFVNDANSDVEGIIYTTGAATLSAPITRANGITCSGNTLTLANTNNAFTGPITINSGVLSLVNGTDSTLGNVANDVFLNGGTFAIDTNDLTTGSGRDFIVGRGNGVVYTSTNGSLHTLTINGNLIDAATGTGSLNVSGTGKVVLNGSANTFSGGLLVNTGATLEIGAGGLANSTIELDRATLNVKSANVGSIYAGMGSKVVLDCNGTLANGIKGNGDLVKTGTGTVTAAFSDFNGNATFGNGKMIVTGTMNSTIKLVSEDGVVVPVLQASGKIGGALTVSNGSLIVGSSAAKLSVGSLSFVTAGTTNKLQIDALAGNGAANAIAGAGYDQIASSGAVSNLGSVDLTVNIAPSQNFKNDVLTIVTSANDLTGQSFGSVKFQGGFGTVSVSGNSVTLSKIAYVGDADQDGVVGGSDYTAWLNNFGVGGATWNQADFDGDGVVGGSDYALWLNNFGVSQSDFGGSVPEPATMCLLALGGAAMLRRRRK